jgi:hypothetical protein
MLEPKDMPELMQEDRNAIDLREAPLAVLRVQENIRIQERARRFVKSGECPRQR